MCSPSEHFQYFSWKSICIRKWNVALYFLVPLKLQVNVHKKLSPQSINKRQEEKGERKGKRKEKKKKGERRDYSLELLTLELLPGFRTKLFRPLSLNCRKKFFELLALFVTCHDRFVREQMSISRDRTCNVLVTCTKWTSLLSSAIPGWKGGGGECNLCPQFTSGDCPVRCRSGSRSGDGLDCGALQSMQCYVG